MPTARARRPHRLLLRRGRGGKWWWQDEEASERATSDELALHTTAHFSHATVCPSALPCRMRALLLPRALRRAAACGAAEPCAVLPQLPLTAVLPPAAAALLAAAAAAAAAAARRTPHAAAHSRRLSSSAHSPPRAAACWSVRARVGDQY
jgi:hypothetical protein